MRTIDWSGRNLTFKAIAAKKFQRPSEIMDDRYLTPLQKRMVLEAMLVEAKVEHDAQMQEPFETLRVGRK